MFIIDVVPIHKTLPYPSLSYFSKEKIERGTLISIPVRKQKIHAIVSNIRTIREARSEIRSMESAIRKIDNPERSEILLTAALDTALIMSRLSIASAGQIIAHLLPEEIQEKLFSLKEKSSVTRNENNFTEYLLLSPKEKLEEKYARIANKNIKQNKNTLLLAPTIQRAEELYTHLSLTLGKEVHLLVSKSKKNIQTILHDDTPRLLVVTERYLFSPLAHIGSIIIDTESSPFLKQERYPLIDMREIARLYARSLDSEIIYADPYPRIETYYNFIQKKIAKHSESEDSWNIKKDEKKSRMVHMSNPAKDDKHKDMRLVLSKEGEKLLEASIKQDKKLFVFVSRRGLATTSICKDCGTLHTCPDCHKPLVLHSKDPHNIFKCHSCNFEETALIACRKCGSWNIETFGIGSELVETTLKKNIPHLHIFRIDADNTKTESKILKTIDQFLTTSGSILIGTESALSRIDKVDNTLVVSMDSLFALPDLFIDEKIFHILSSIRERTMETVVIQTRSDNQDIFKHGLTGDYRQFYEESIESRDGLCYPPFFKLVRVSMPNRKDILERGMILIQNNASIKATYSFPSAKKIRGLSAVDVLLSIKEEDITKNHDFFQKLSTFSFIDIFPNTLLK